MSKAHSSSSCSCNSWVMQNQTLSIVVARVVKVVRTRGPTRPTTGLGRVGLKFFYKCQYGSIFEPGWPTKTYGHTHYVGLYIVGLFF